MPSKQAGCSSAESEAKYHHLQHQRPGGSPSFSPCRQSSLATPVNQFQRHHQQQQQQQQQQSLLYDSPPQNRALPTSQPSSLTMYKVSPITRENSNEMSTFNPHLPYRSMAPSHSRFFDPGTHGSPSDSSHRNVGPGVVPFSSSSPLPFRRVISSPQSSELLHSQGGLHATKKGLHEPCGVPAAEAVHTSTTAELGFTAVRKSGSLQHAGGSPKWTRRYRSGMTSASVAEMSSSYPSKPTQGTMLASSLTPDGNRLHVSAPRSSDPLPQRQPQQISLGVSRGAPTAVAGWSSRAVSGAATSAVSARRSTSPSSTSSSLTILQRKQPDNLFPAVNSSLEGQLPPSSSHPSLDPTRQVQPRSVQHPPLLSQRFECPTGSPPSPPHTSVAPVSPSPLREPAPLTALPSYISGASSPSDSRVTGSAGQRASPQPPPRAASVDSSNGPLSFGSEPSSSEASSSFPPPPLQQRSPAMYGVIGLPYARADAAAGQAASASDRNSNVNTNATPAVAPPFTQFHAIPLSSTKASDVAKLGSPLPQPEQQQQQQQVEQGDGSHHYHLHHSAMEASSPPVDDIDSAAAATVASSGAGTPITAHLCTSSSVVSAQYRKSIARSGPGSNKSSTNTDFCAAVNASHDRFQAVPAVPVLGQTTNSARITPLSPPPQHSNRGDEDKIRPGEKEDLQRSERQPPPPPPNTSVTFAAVMATRARSHVSAAAPTAVAASVLETVHKPEQRVSNTSTSSVAVGETGKMSPKLTADTVLPVAVQEEELRFSSSTTDTTERSSSNRRPQANAAATSSTAGDFSGIVVRQRREWTKQQSQRQSPLRAGYPGKPTIPLLTGYSFVSSRAHLQQYIDQWRDRFEEDKNAYKEGGYLSVVPGKIVHSRYVLIQKLGWGEFSTVWLAYDTKHATLGRGATQAFVAVKAAKCRSSVQEATHYEVSLLRYIEARLPPHAAVTNIIDCFDVQGDFGTHTCMVMPLCGPNLLSIIDRLKGQRGRRSADDLRLVKEILFSILVSLHELSVLNVMHTDIKPENVLCCAVDTKLMNSMEKFCSYNKDRSHMISTDEFHEAMAQRTSDHLVCLVDFGLSALLEPPGSAAKWTALCPNVRPFLLAPLMRCKRNFNVTKSGVMENLRGTLIQTREYRAPEVLLGLDFTCTTDVWSVGCMAFELITGNFLMDPKKKTRNAGEMDVEHLAMMMQLIGPLPPEITDVRVHNNDYYEAEIRGASLPRRTTRPPPPFLHRFVDKDGNFIYASRYRAYPRRNLEMELEPYLNFREARLAANFILSCLCCYDPKNRLSAKKLLGHPWFQNIGMPSKDKNGCV
ncbi:putative protein kinase [Leptomonas seymouri]|uniref:non-specific serine/threonine protein kinase n=1 Tax=Leptomonas seymouri TaxID=5684 RepID=A0A0N1PCG0_LEPSE|nr:putative protein kinase [Leptomonas seymouri]|eukprot:KPI87225.1 putative protein kinase [Leptomonas seymouri]